MAEEVEDGDFEFRSRVDEELEYFTDLALNETQRWIESVTRQDFAYPEDPRKSLENGVLLCKLLNCIKAGSIKRINKLPTPIAGLDNLNVFLRACEEHFGLRGGQLFDPGDLQDLSNRAIADTADIKYEVDRRLRNVCITVYWLGRSVERFFNGPKLDFASYSGLVTGSFTSAPPPLEHKYEKHYTQNYYQESTKSGPTADHNRQASSDSLDYSSAYGSLRSGEYHAYHDEHERDQHLTTPQHFRDSSYDSSGSFERPFSDEGSDSMPVRENNRRHSSGNMLRNQDQRFSATFDSYYAGNDQRIRDNGAHYGSDDNLAQTAPARSPEAKDAYNRFRVGGVHQRYSSQDSLDSEGYLHKHHAPEDTGFLATRLAERKSTAAHANPNQFIAMKTSPLARAAQEQIQISQEIKKIRHSIDHDDEDWKSNLSSWKSRRKSHSSATPHLDDTEYNEGVQRRPKTFSQMAGDREKRRASGYFGYSTKDYGNHHGEVEDETFTATHMPTIEASPAPKSHSGLGHSYDDMSLNYSKQSTSPSQQEIEEEEESSEESSDDDEIIGPQLLHQSKRSTVMMTSARQGHMRLVVNMNLPREEYLEDKGWGLTVKGGKDKGLPITLESITPDSAAEEAELKPGDEITAINGESMADVNHGYIKLLMNKAANVMGRMELFIRREYKPGDLPQPKETTQEKKTPYKPVQASKPPTGRKLERASTEDIKPKPMQMSPPPAKPREQKQSPQKEEECDSETEHLERKIMDDLEKEAEEQELAKSYQKVLEDKEMDSRMSTFRSEADEDLVQEEVIAPVQLERKAKVSSDVDRFLTNSDYSPPSEQKQTRDWQNKLKASWDEKQDDDLWSSPQETDIPSEQVPHEADSVGNTVNGSDDNEPVQEDVFMSREVARVEAKIQMQKEAHRKHLPKSDTSEGDNKTSSVTVGVIAPFSQQEEIANTPSDQRGTYHQPGPGGDNLQNEMDSEEQEIIETFEKEVKIKQEVKVESLTERKPFTFRSMDEMKSHSLRNKEKENSLESKVAKDFENTVQDQPRRIANVNRRSLSLEEERRKMEDWGKEQDRLRQEKYEEEQRNLKDVYTQRNQELEKRKQHEKDLQQQKIQNMDDARMKESQRYRGEQKRLLEEQRQRTEQRLKEEEEKRKREEERKRIIQEQMVKEDEDRLEEFDRNRRETEEEYNKQQQKLEEQRARQKHIDDERKLVIKEQKQQDVEQRRKSEETAMRQEDERQRLLKEKERKLREEGDRQRSLREKERQLCEKQEDDRQRLLREKERQLRERQEDDMQRLLQEKERKLLEQEERLRKEQERLREEQLRFQREKEEQHQIWLRQQEELRKTPEEDARKQKMMEEQSRASPTSMEVSSYRLLQQHSPPIKLGPETPPLVLTREEILKSNKRPAALDRQPVKSNVAPDSPQFVSRQDVLKINRRVSNTARQWEDRSNSSSSKDNSPVPRMTLRSEFVPKPWEPSSRENSPPKRIESQNKFPKVGPKPSLSVRAAVEEADRTRHLWEDQQVKNVHDVNVHVHDVPASLTREEVLKMNKKPMGVTSEQRSSPVEQPKPVIRAGQREPLDKKGMKSINAVPRPRQIRDDGWIVSANDQEKKKEDAKNRRRSDWIKPHEPLRDLNDHWLVQEAERRRIAEKQEREYQQKMQQNEQEIRPQRMAQSHSVPNQEVNAQTNNYHDSPSNDYSNSRKPEWLIDVTKQEAVAQNTDQQQSYYPPTESSETYQDPYLPNHETKYTPTMQSSSYPVNTPSPPQKQLENSHNSSLEEDMLSVSAKQLCAYCNKELGRGAAMVIESLNLYYHVNCFRCCVCHTQLSNGNMGADVRVRVSKLHCKNCYSNDEAGIKYSQV